MYVEAGTILFGYLFGKSELINDIKSFGDKMTFWKDKKNTLPDVIKKNKNKEFFFGENIEFEVYSTRFFIDTINGSIGIGNNKFNILENEDSYIEKIRFGEKELEIEIKTPSEFWHTNKINIPYGILFHPDFLNKYNQSK